MNPSTVAADRRTTAGIRRSPRYRALLTAGGLVASALTTGAIAGSPARAAACAAKPGAGWSMATAPTFTASATEHFTTVSVMVATDPATSARMFATNGKSIVGSTDGGCSWTKKWSLDVANASTSAPGETAQLDTSYRISSIRVGSAAGQSVVYAVLAPGTNAAVPVLVASSTNSGGTWTVNVVAPGGNAGIPTSSTYSPQVVLAVSPTSGATAYLATDYANGLAWPASRAKGMYVTTDAGATWTSVAAAGIPNGWFEDASFSGDNPGAGVDAELAVDPSNPHTVWAIWPRPTLNVYKSTNGGASFTLALTNSLSTPTPFDPPFFSAFKTGKGYCYTVRNNAVVTLSSDGKSWKALPALPKVAGGPGEIEGATCTASGKVIALVGYQPSAGQIPPFGVTTLYLFNGKKWSSLGAPPTASKNLGFGSVTISRSTAKPVVVFQAANADPAQAATTYLLRYTGSALG
jgi:hypothetical protein